MESNSFGVNTLSYIAIIYEEYIKKAINLLLSCFYFPSFEKFDRNEKWEADFWDVLRRGVKMIE